MPLSQCARSQGEAPARIHAAIWLEGEAQVVRTPSVSARDRVLLAVIALLAVLYLASIGPYWNISPDSATYVGWAKALVAGVPFARGPVQPPVTSFIYAAVLTVFPD